MDNVERLREAAATLLSMSDIDAVTALMFASGKWPTEVANASGELCRPNGRADRLATKFRSDPAAARTYCRALIRRFHPFAEIVREILPGPGKWTQQTKCGDRGLGAKPHKFLTVAEVDELHKAGVWHEMVRTAVAYRFLQSHPQHTPAKVAEAACQPPKPRAHGLRARLDTSDEIENAAAETDPQPTTEPKRTREKPALVFVLPPQRTDTEGEQTTMSEQTQTPKPAAPEKLEVAKAYTVHIGGVIRAICVSKADRDEIVAALDLYRKTKAAPGEIESALAFYRNARIFLGIEAQPDKGQADATATGEPPQQ